MKKLTFILLMIQIPFAISAQLTKERDVIGSSGNFASVSNIQLSWTVGELAVASANTPNLIVNEGFQQGNLGAVGVEESIEVNFTIYPNPVGDDLFFNIYARENMVLYGEVYDLAGKRVIYVPEFSVGDSYTGQIDFRHLPAGKWLLKFTNEAEGTYKIFSVVKLN